MRALFLVLVLCLSVFGIAQNGLGIMSNFQVHQGASIGIHADLVSEAQMQVDNNTLVGFYGDVPNFIDGNVPLNFYDVEFANSVVVFLRTQLNVRNNANFVSGNLLTPLNLDNAFIQFEPNGFYTGVQDLSKVEGFVAVTQQNDFIFPVGSQDQLRNLLFQASTTPTLAKCAYIRENPSSPTSLNNTSFNTESKVNTVGQVINSEFWILQSETEGRVTLSWNVNSGLPAIAQSLEEVILVGFRKSDNQWVPLSENTATGDLSDGLITSNTFVPNNYAAITFGTLPLPTDTFAVNNPTLGNYFVSPNQDGVNDFLVFDNLTDTGSNQVDIYNKFGQKVFTQANYTNQFTGVANTGDFILKQEIGLPEGVYYYTINLPDLELAYQGYLFLNR